VGLIIGGFVIVAAAGCALVAKDWRKLRKQASTLNTQPEEEKSAGPDPVVISMRAGKPKKGKRKKHRKEPKKIRPFNMDMDYE